MNLLHELWALHPGLPPLWPALGLVDLDHEEGQDHHGSQEGEDGNGLTDLLVVAARHDPCKRTSENNQDNARSSELGCSFYWASGHAAATAYAQRASGAGLVGTPQLYTLATGMHRVGEQTGSPLASALPRFSPDRHRPQSSTLPDKGQERFQGLPMSRRSGPSLRLQVRMCWGSTSWGARQVTRWISSTLCKWLETRSGTAGL